MHDDSDTQGKDAGDDKNLPSGGGADGGDDFDLMGFSGPEESAPAKKPASRPPSPGGYGAKGPGSTGPRKAGPGGKDRDGAPRRFGDREGKGRFEGRGDREGAPRRFGDRGPRAPRDGDAGPRREGPAGPRRFDRGGYDRKPEGAGPRRFDRKEPGDRPTGRFDREAGPRRFDPKGPGDRAPRRFDGEGPRREGPSGPPRRFDREAGPRRFTPAPGSVGAGERKPVSYEVKPFLPLKTDKGRYKESRFLLEGSKNIADVLAVSPAMLQQVFVTEDFKDKDLLTALKKQRIEPVTVTADDIAALSDTEAPQGVIAVANFATLKIDYNTARYITLLDAVQDPGNVGAILRTSLALGMDAVVMGKGTCDPYNAKVVRSSVGALLQMPFETNEGLESKIRFLREKGYSVVASSSHAKITLDQAKLRKKVALIVGNEGAGSGASYLDMADAVVKIAMKNKVESLNVAVAHGILSHQLVHGRD